MIPASCPHCGTVHEIPDDMIGLEICCNCCDKEFVVSRHSAACPSSRDDEPALSDGLMTAHDKRPRSLEPRQEQTKRKGAERQKKERNSSRALCPYCRHSFESKPKRSRKCPQCAERIVVRKGKLYTEAAAEEEDQKRAREASIRQKQQHIHQLRQYKAAGVAVVQILGTQDDATCRTCRELDGNYIRVKDALRQSDHVPPFECCRSEVGFCRCTIVPVVDAPQVSGHNRSESVGMAVKRGKKMTRCKACGHSVSRKAATCPNCGEPVKRKPASIPTSLGCLIIIAFIVGIALVYNAKPSRRDSRQSSTAGETAEALDLSRVRERLEYEIAREVEGREYRIHDLTVSNNRIILVLDLRFEPPSVQFLRTDAKAWADLILYSKIGDQYVIKTELDVRVTLYTFLSADRLIRWGSYRSDGGWVPGEGVALLAIPGHSGGIIRQ